jgi:hypothetical protein
MPGPSVIFGWFAVRGGIHWTVSLTMNSSRNTFRGAVRLVGRLLVQQGTPHRYAHLRAEEKRRRYWVFRYFVVDALRLALFLQFQPLGVWMEIGEAL